MNDGILIDGQIRLIARAMEKKEKLRARKDRSIKKYPGLQAKIEKCETTGQVRRLIRAQFD